LGFLFSYNHTFCQKLPESVRLMSGSFRSVSNCHYT